MPRRALVVGASLAGLRCAEALRRAGFDGEIDIIGEESHRPYNRPPLSKERRSGKVTPEWLRSSLQEGEVTWRLGAPAVSADLTARTVTLASGELLAWDGLAIATGLRPRRLGIPGPQRGRHVLRTLNDADALCAAMTGAHRIAVIGAGFIGCEIAALAAGSGAEVHVIAPEPVPLERPCGKLLGDEIQRRLEVAGIRFHLGVLPVEYLGGERVTGIALSDAAKMDADVVIEAVGSVPNVEWLAGNGLDLADGLLCAANLCVQDRPDVVACGDVARFPNLLFDRVPRRVEHWSMAVDTARRAGTTLAGTLAGCPVPEDTFTPVPSFWSHHDAVRLQSFGSPGLGSEDIRVLEGELEGEAAVGYHRDGELVGVILLGLVHRYAHYRQRVADLRERSTDRSPRNFADGTR